MLVPWNTVPSSSIKNAFIYPCPFFFSQNWTFSLLVSFVHIIFSLLLFKFAPYISGRRLYRIYAIKTSCADLFSFHQPSQAVYSKIPKTVCSDDFAYVVNPSVISDQLLSLGNICAEIAGP